ncbi:MAG: hypothetical protein ABIU63_02675 [Chitinophagaceae bacterium]
MNRPIDLTFFEAIGAINAVAPGVERLSWQKPVMAANSRLCTWPLNNWLVSLTFERANMATSSKLLYL